MRELELAEYHTCILSLVFLSHKSLTKHTLVGMPPNAHRFIGIRTVWTKFRTTSKLRVIPCNAQFSDLFQSSRKERTDTYF